MSELRKSDENVTIEYIRQAFAYSRRMYISPGRYITVDTLNENQVVIYLIEPAKEWYIEDEDKVEIL